MRYLPLSDAERQQILKTCGVASFDELVAQVPAPLKLKALLDLEEPLSEPELKKIFSDLASKNSAAQMTSFLGQGVYPHHIPTVVDQITNRGEFLTAYTPYQPEISQGTLQSIFEFQSMVAGLFGMEVSNASLYDGATSVVEAVLMASRLQNKKAGKVVVAEGVYNNTLEVMKSYLEPLGFEIVPWLADSKDQRSLLQNLPSCEDPVAVVLQSPNTWGAFESWGELQGAAKQLKTKSIAISGHPSSCALFEAPGHFGVDIVCAEGQPLGVPMGFGGPHLGLFACRKSDVRQMPGRLVGLTSDSFGQRAFCVTLSTREQHIRREKATSNICSNQNLIALRSAIYMALMGEEGLRRVAETSRDIAVWARQEISQKLLKSHPECRVTTGEIFNEFCVFAPSSSALWLESIQKTGEKQKMLAGTFVPTPKQSGMSRALALAFTELHSEQDVQKLVNLFEAE